jgi:hypothetical protein
LQTLLLKKLRATGSRFAIGTDGRGDRKRRPPRGEDISSSLLAQQTGLKDRLGQFLHEQRHAVGFRDDLSLARAPPALAMIAAQLS